MDDFRVKWDAKSQRNFTGLLREMQQVTKREMPIVIRNAGRDFCRHGMRLTPLSEPRYAESDFRVDGGYWVTVKHRGTGKLHGFVGTLKQLKEHGMVKPGDRIRGRGFARVGWILALIKLGVRMSFPAGKTPSLASIQKSGDFVDGRRQPAPFVEVANQVPYIEKLDKGELGSTPHNIMARAMHRTAQGMEKTLTRLSQRMAERWNR